MLNDQNAGTVEEMISQPLKRTVITFSRRIR